MGKHKTSKKNVKAIALLPCSKGFAIILQGVKGTNNSFLASHRRFSGKEIKSHNPKFFKRLKTFDDFFKTRGQMKGLKSEIEKMTPLRGREADAAIKKVKDGKIDDCGDSSDESSSEESSSDESSSDESSSDASSSDESSSDESSSDESSSEDDENVDKFW
jgi:hypothetical protein